MDWVRLITDRARISGVLRVDELARELNTSEIAVGNALRRQEKRGLVEHLGKKIFINRLVPDFSGLEIINMLRPEAYLSLETVLRDSGISTQSPTVLTCVTPGRPGEFRAKSVSISFRRISRNLFWGFQKKRTRFGEYNIAEPEKALLDWVYLRRQEGSTINTDELDLERLDLRKLLEFAAKFPIPVKQQITEAVANLNIAIAKPGGGTG
jgi:predicted DNA-binding transcriptional regulator